MSLLDILGGGITTIIETVAKPFTIAQERKKEVALQDKEIEKIQAQGFVEAAKQGKLTQSNWDEIALKNSEKSWKDEYLTILLYFPVMALFFVAMFMPEKIEDVKLAVKSLEDFPQWYQFILWGIVAHAFGLRWLVEPLVTFIKTRNK